MKTLLIDANKDMPTLEAVSRAAFSTTPDASLDEWLSFSYMKEMILEGRGYALKALTDEEEVAGIIYAQQENPVNSKEGEEKWVIIIAGIDPKYTGQGVGSLLLKDLESLAKQKQVKKLFTFTNKDDEQVIHFYRKNGYEDAGWIKDYQYGNGNSAVFLLKHLD
jgi:ribosomal protein S18 acetylase RimI-like enzyme